MQNAIAARRARRARVGRVAYTFFALCLGLVLFSFPAQAATIRLTGPTDTTFNPGAVDDTRTIGDTVALDLWIDASDTDVNGFEATIVYDGTRLQLLDSSLVTDSFPPDSPGIQSREDRSVFGDVFFNYGLASGTTADTARYAALTLADSTRANARAVRFTFLIRPTAPAGLTYVTFRSTAEETTAITYADTSARNVLTATDTGVILIQGVADTHLVLTLVAPNTPEHFAIYNPTGAAVDLSNYYVSDDDSNYVRVVNAPAVSSGDWIVRFPAGTILAAGDTLTVAISSDDLHGVMPGMPVDFEIAQDGDGDGVADMTLVATSGTRGLTNAGEAVILFYWDGASDLVKDVDILVYGTGTIPNKTGKSLDGPDGDAIGSTYLNDSATMTRPAAPAAPQVLRRTSFVNGDSGTGESTTGGNGLTGHDETTESAAVSWAATTDSQPWHTALVAYKIGDIPTSIAEAGETGVEALYIRVRGARGQADTLTRIDVRTLGTADTANIDTVSVWIDADGDSVIGAADTFVGNLTATGSSTWRFTGAIGLPAVTGYRDGVSLILGFAAGLSVQSGETVQFQLDTYGLHASLSESGSFRALVNANPVTLVAGVLRVTKLAEAAAVTFKPGDTGVTVAAIRVTGVSTDSLTNIAVANLGLLDNLDVAVQLWRDSDQSFTYSHGDVLVGTFGWSTDRLRWELTGLAEPLSIGGETFVVTISAFDTALPEGDTFQALFPAFSADAVAAETGPALAVSNANVQTLISLPGTASHVVIAAFYADESGVDDNGEWVLLYNPTDTPVNVQNWVLRRTAAVLATLPDSTIPARGWYLVAANQYDTAKDQAAWPTADFRPSSFASLNNTNNGIQLTDSTGVILDRVGYGTEATMKEGTTVSNPTSQQVYVRRPHVLADNGSVLAGGRDEQGGAGYDSYDNATDFIAIPQSDLGAWVLRNSASPSETPAWKTTSIRLQDTPANATVRSNESGVTAAVVFLRGDTSAAGTLEAFRVEATDPIAETNLAHVRLYRDNNADRRWDMADSLVAVLAPTGSSAWESTVIGWPFNALAGETFLVVVAASETVTMGETLQLRIAARTVKASGAESGPTTVRVSGTVLTLSPALPLTVSLNASIGNETVTPTADSLTVIAFRIAGNPSGDTLTRFTVANAGAMDTGDITQVQLFADADRDSRHSPGDTFIATLTARAPRLWEASGLAYYLGSGLDFVVTIDLGTAGDLDSFRAYIPAQGVSVALYDTGPSDSVSENGRVTVSSAQAVRMILTEVDVQTGTDYVELWVLDDGNGGAGVNVAGWTITEHPLGSADRKVFGDTDNNGTVDTIVWARTGDRIVVWDVAGIDSDVAVAGVLDLFNAGITLTATNDEVLLYDPVNTLRDAVAWSNRDRTHTDAADLAAVIAAGGWQGFATENSAVTPRTGSSFVAGYSIQRGGLVDRDTYLDWGEAPRTPGTANIVDSPPIPMARISGIQLLDNPNDLGGSLRLTWTPDTSNPKFLEYRIYVETYPLRSLLETNAAPIATVTDSRIGSAIIGGLVNGDSYYAVVTAVDTFGLEYRFGLSDTGPAAPLNNITGLPRILVNEVFAQATGGTDTDYIELYVLDDGNPSGSIDLTGWKVTWHSSGTKTFGATTVSTGDYILLTFNTAATDDPDSSGDGVVNVWHAGTGLAAASGYVRVATPADSVVDFLFYAERTASLAAALQTAVRAAVDSGAWRGDSTVNSAVNGRAVDGGFLSNDIFARDGASSDTANSRDEWNVQTVRTPGAANAGGEHPIVLNDTRVVRVFKDLENDFGGVLVIGWDTDVTQADFLRYNIYLESAPIGSRIDTGSMRPDSTIGDSSVGMTTITGLRDGESYYVVVTVTDSWGHERRIGLVETGPVAPLRNVGAVPVIKITEVKFAGTDTSEFIELRVLSDGNATGQLNLAGFKVAADDTVAGDILTFGDVTVTDSDYIVLRNAAGTSEVDSGGDGVVDIYGVPLGLVATDEGIFLMTAADTILDFVYWSNRDGTASAAEQADLAYAIARGAWTHAGQNGGRNPVILTTFPTSTSITRDALATDNDGDTDWAVDSPPTPGGIPNIVEAPFSAPAAVAGLVAADVPHDFGGSILLTWTPAGVADLYLYNIYRETSPLPSSLYGTNLYPRDTAGPADSTFLLNGLTDGETWWFAVIAVDSHGNERKFGYAVESAAARVDITIDTRLPNAWYLNDTSTAGDSFTGAPGSDAANGLTRWTPKRTWAAIRPFLTVGDSVYIDSGIYHETVVIDTDHVTVLGVDSASTILSGVNNAAAHDTGIAATGRNGVRVENLRVTGGTDGIVLTGSDSAVLRRVRVTSVAGDGMRLTDGSDSAILEEIRIDGAGSRGLAFHASDSPTVRSGVFANSVRFDSATDGVHFIGNRIASTGGVSFEESSFHHVIADNVSQDAAWSLPVRRSTIANNTSLGHSAGVVVFMLGGESNTFTGNSATASFFPAFDLGGVGHTVANCSALLGSNVGFSLTGFRSGTFSGNVAYGNGSYGVSIEGSESSIVSGNRIESNTLSGLRIAASAGLRVAQNLISTNRDHGLLLDGDTGNIVVQNRIESNTNYQVWLQNGSNGTVLAKNVIIPSAARPDSLVRNLSSPGAAFTRNWWGSFDTLAFARGVVGLPVVHTPFRLGVVDTTAGADTVAPRAPDTVAAVGATESAIVVTWSAVTVSEEPEGAVGLAGYRVWRSRTADTSSWEPLVAVGAATHVYTDSGFQPAETWYYRVTAFDGAAVENQSFYSDSIARGTTPNETTPPSAFTLLVPTAGYDTASTRIEFAWSTSTDSSGPVRYRLLVDTDMVGSYLVDTTVLETTVVIPVLPVNDTYTWRVTALDSWGNATTAGDSRFVIDTVPPTVPTLIGPANFLDTSSTDLLFSWFVAFDTLSGLSGYRLQVDTSPTFTSPLVDSFTTALSGRRTLVPNDTYYWRVLSVDDAGNTAADTARRIRIDTVPPSAPAAIYPVAFSETNAVSVGFLWTASADTLSGLFGYRFQVDTTGLFSGPLAVDSPQATNETALALSEGLWYWRVRAVDSAGNASAYTDSVAFRVDRTPPVILAVLPVSAVPGHFTDSGGIDTAAFSDTVWFNNGGFGAGQAVTVTVLTTGADTVAFPQTFGEGPVEDSTIPFAFQYTIEPGHADTHTLIVARDTAGNIDTVLVHWIRDTVPPPATTLTNPVELQVTGDSTPSFSWLASIDTGVGTVRYMIQVAADTAFTVVVESAFVSTLSYTSSPLADSIWYWRVIGYDSVSNADTAAAIVRSFRIDSGIPVIAAIAVVSSAPTFFFDDTPVVPGLVPDTVYYNPTGAGAGQVCTITVWVTDINETAVELFSSYTAIRTLDSGLDRDSYELILQIPLDSASSAVRLVATDATGFQDTSFVWFEMDTTGPSAPVGQSPADDYDTAAPTIAFSWSGSTDTRAGLAGYRLQIDTSSSFAAPLVDSPTGLALSGTRTLAPNDTYWWRVIAVDRVGCTTAGPARVLRIDTVPPTVATLTGPADGLDTSSSTIRFSWLVAFDTLSGLARYRLQVDTSPTFASPIVDSTLPSSSLSAWRTLAIDDTYWWRVVAVDSAGNTSADTARSFRIDSTVPTAPALHVLNGETSVTPPTLRWTASTDTLSGIMAYIVQVDTSPSFASPLESATLAWNDTDHVPALTPADTYYWRVYAVDSAGNLRLSTPAFDSYRIFVQDTTPPSAFTPTLPPDLHETRATTMTLRWTDSLDETSPPVRYRIQLDTEGAFTAPYYDTTGYLETYAVITAFRANETTTWRVIASDNAGNTTVVTTAWRVIVDTTPPAVFTLTAPAMGTDTRSTSITFTWAASSDTIAGLSGYRLQLDTAGTFASLLVDSATPLTTGTRTLAANDTYYWRVVAVDDAGNTVAAGPNVLRIDTAAPAAGVLLTPANGHNTTVVTMAFTWTAATDTVSGLAGYHLQVDTSAAFLAPIVDSATGLATAGTLSSLRANDTLFWRVLAVDVAGNTTAYAAFAFLVDTAGPTAATPTAPAAFHDTTATTITFAWSASTDTGSGVSGYRLQVDTSGTFTALLVDSAAGSALAGTRTLPANDTYWWRVVAVDNMGNTTAGTPRRLRIDTAPPSRPILVAFASDSTLAPLTLRWSSVSDSIVGVARFVVQIDTAPSFSAPTESTVLAATETSHLTGNLKPDTWFWRVAAYDTLGNVAVSLVDTFVVRSSDTTPPSAFSLVSPSDRAFTSSTAITFTWGVSVDDTSPPVTYRLQVDTSGAFLALVAETSGLAGTSTVLTLAANDTYWWRVIARDNVGNTTVATSAFRISVDTRPPSTPVLVARSGASVNTPLYLAWSAVTDSISGVARFLLQVDSDPTFASPFTDSLYQSPLDTDYWTGALAVETYYWRVLAYDTAGNVAASATDSFRVAVPDSVGPVFLGATAAPSSVNNSGTTSVTFTILVTDSTYVTSVLARLAPVGGSDSSFATPATAVPSADSRWTLTFTVDSSVSGGIYDLVVYAFDPNMNSSTTTVRLVVVDTSAPFTQLLESSIYLLRVSGNAISIISTYGDSYSKVLYQYRLLPTGGWQNCTPATGSTNPDTVPPFWGFYWDVSMLAPGGYDIRAVGTDLSGMTDPNPSSVRMYINPIDSNVHEYRDPVTGRHIRRQKFSSDSVGHLAIADGTGLEVPAGAMTDSGWIRITVLDTNTSSSPLPSFLIAVAGGTFRELTREDGVRVFGKDVRITLPYADTDPLDDYVGRTTTREADLAMYYYDTAISAWVRIPTSIVDPVRNVVHATVNHFTVFAVLAGAPAAPSLVDFVLYPNPFVPYDGNDRNGKPYDGSDPSSGIIFDSLPLQVTVEVFDITGRKVAQMSKNSNDARYHWDARGDDGRELASGIYIVVVRAPVTSERVIKKLMIIR